MKSKNVMSKIAAQVFKTSMTLAVITVLMVYSNVLGQNENPPEVSIAGTQLLHLHSDVVGQDYDLLINLPRDYNDESKSFPVLYLIDAQWDFPLAQAIYGQQYYDGFVPSMIIVGITWGGENPNYDSLRACDLTPTNVRQVPGSGRAPKFVQFIKTELVPFIDKRFRTIKDDRTLVGSSYGGLFTLYTLFTETSLFNRYVLTSPALGYDNNVIYKFEQKYFDNHKDLPVNLFIGIGGYEDVTSFQKFVDVVKSRDYQGLQLQTRVLDGFGHSGGKAEGYSRGIQFVFQKPNLKLDNDILNQYTGTYKLNPMANVKVSNVDGQLIVDAPGNQKFALLATSETEFYVKGFYLLVHFKKTSDGKVTGFELETFGQKFNVEKID